MIIIVVVIILLTLTLILILSLEDMVKRVITFSAFKLFLQFTKNTLSRSFSHWNSTFAERKSFF